jgi:hypothetical protein
MGRIYSAVYFPNGFPKSTGIVPWDYVSNTTDNTTPYDWVDSKVDGIGNQSTVLYCRAMPLYKQEDFYQYFTGNEVLWYKLFLLASQKIYRMYEVLSSNLVSATTVNNTDYFPTFAYTLTSFVKSATVTKDNKYKVYSAFNIHYDSKDSV